MKFNLCFTVEKLTTISTAKSTLKTGIALY